MIVIASGREVSIWNASTGRLAQTYGGHTADVLDAMFSADGQRVVSASADGSVHLWDRASGALIDQLRQDGTVERALLSPGGRRVLTEWMGKGTDGFRDYTSLWDISHRRELTRLDQMQKPLGFSPDGRTIPVVDGPTFNGRCCRLDSLLDAATGSADSPVSALVRRNVSRDAVPALKPPPCG